jgi:hypothetical protein
VAGVFACVDGRIRTYRKATIAAAVGGGRGEVGR